MTNDNDVHDSGRIVKAVDDPVVADSDAPESIPALQLADANGAWVGGQSLDFSKDAASNCRFQSLEFLPC